jgi:RNA polymerase sigma-70 factor (ECF subfamily)
MAYLAARLAPAGDRDDIVQEALSRAWMRRTTYDPTRGTVRVWLLAIVADQARRSRQRSRWAHFKGTNASPVESQPIEPELDLQRALCRLSARQRLAIDLYYFVDLDVEETAAVMGCSAGTVKSTLSEARGRLRQLLEER